MNRQSWIEIKWEPTEKFGWCRGQDLWWATNCNDHKRVWTADHLHAPTERYYVMALQCKMFETSWRSLEIATLNQYRWRYHLSFKVGSKLKYLNLKLYHASLCHGKISYHQKTSTYLMREFFPYDIHTYRESIYGTEYNEIY